MPNVKLILLSPGIWTKMLTFRKQERAIGTLVQPSATVKCKFYVGRGGLQEAGSHAMNNRHLTTINKSFTGRDSRTLRCPFRNLIVSWNRHSDFIKKNTGCHNVSCTWSKLYKWTSFELYFIEKSPKITWWLIGTFRWPPCPLDLNPLKLHQRQWVLLKSLHSWSWNQSQLQFYCIANDTYFLNSHHAYLIWIWSYKRSNFGAWDLTILDHNFFMPFPSWFHAFRFY